MAFFLSCVLHIFKQNWLNLLRTPSQVTHQIFALPGPGGSQKIMKVKQLDVGPVWADLQISWDLGWSWPRLPSTLSLVTLTYVNLDLDHIACKIVKPDEESSL